VGQQIGKTPIGWCHTECIIAAIPTDEKTAP